MGQFRDDFDRANGALGGNWTSIYGNLDILGGWCRQNGVGYGCSTNSTLSDSGRHQCTVRVTSFTGSTNTCGPVVKFIPGNQGCYSAQIRYAAPTYYLTIYAGTIGAMSAIASVALDAFPGGINIITLVWEDGELTASLDSGESVSVSNNAFVNGTVMGILAQTTVAQVDWVVMTTGEQPDFQVTPEVVGNYGDPTELTFTGTNTAWTAGTPGSPTFTCDHGTLTNQVVESATLATATFDPGSYLGPVVITDPSTGLTDTIIVTSDPDVLPPGEICPFDQDFIDLANASEKRTIDDQLMTEGTVVTGFDYPFNNLTVPEALGEIWVALFHTGMPLPEGMSTSLFEVLWELVNGRYDPGMGPWQQPSGIPLMHQLDEIRTDLNDLRTGAEWNLDDLALVLGGSPVKSHQDILNAIGTSADYSDVIDALSQLRGDSLSTVREAILQLNAIRTGGLYTLGDVIEAINGLGSGISVDLGPILTKLHEIQPNESYDLTTLTSLLVNLGNVVGAISNSLTSYRTPSMYTVQHILDAIAAARAAIVAAVERVRVPPIWPGAEHVQLGASYDLSTTAVVTEPMDGVLVSITGTDPGTSFFQYQGMRAWRHIGGLTFFQEGGYCETHQALGFSSAIYVPKTMVRASGVRLFLGHGPQGTLRPWTIL